MAVIGLARSFGLAGKNSMPDSKKLDPTKHPDLAKLERFASLLDDRFHIPGTKIRFGLDSVIGLIPGVGDAASALTHSYLFWSAFQLRVRKRILGKMLFNALVDLIGGAVPVAGDIFDVYWKSNRRNATLIRRELQTQGRLRRGRGPAA